MNKMNKKCVDLREETGAPGENLKLSSEKQQVRGDVVPHSATMWLRLHRQIIGDVFFCDKSEERKKNRM